MDHTEYRHIAAYSEIHHSLATICTSLTLETLIVENIEEFPVKMCNIFCLSTLNTFNTSFQATTQLSTRNSRGYPRNKAAKLNTLTCDFTFFIPSHWINNKPSPLQQLKTLHVGFGRTLRSKRQNPSAQSQLHHIVSLCASTLENLEIQLLGPTPFISASSAGEPLDDGNLFPLNSLLTLRQLSFIVSANKAQIPQGATRTLSFDRIVEVTRALKTFGKAPLSLQSIVIVLTVEPSVDEQFIGFKNPFDGEDLFRTLASFRFANVEHIEVIFLIVYGRWLESISPSPLPFLNNLISTVEGEDPRLHTSIKWESFTNYAERRTPALQIP